MADIIRTLKNFLKAPFSAPRTHRFLRGKIPAERHWDGMDFGQWNNFPPVSGWNLPFPEAEASMPRAGNNSPLAWAKSCGGSNSFHRPLAGRGGARGTVFGVCKVFFRSATRSKLVPFPSQEHFVQRFPNWERPQQGWPEVFLPDPDPDPALGARQRGQPAQPSLRLCPTARWDKALLLFAAKGASFSSTLEAEVEEKNVEPCKTGISTETETLLRRCSETWAETFPVWPEQRPAHRPLGLLSQHPPWLSTSCKRV